MKIQAHTTKPNDARQANGGYFGIIMEHLNHSMRHRKYAIRCARCVLTCNAAAHTNSTPI